MSDKLELAEKFEKPNTSSCPREVGREPLLSQAGGQDRVLRSEERKDKLAQRGHPTSVSPRAQGDNPLRVVVLLRFSFPNLLDVPLLSNSALDPQGEGGSGKHSSQLNEPV